ncbi:hypothetical protein TanjilG_26907 [Lupinus angustifolius]|uniref:Uncharacterized protein n=1 Tax=Lupinus angustifolius TaxID=3871 RepID=A0A4P1RIS9_LUPAN|nr:hypothetical protein TanjilG_26907 [Lupinus angustifolius]
MVGEVISEDNASLWGDDNGRFVVTMQATVGERVVVEVSMGVVELVVVVKLMVVVIKAVKFDVVVIAAK